MDTQQLVAALDQEIALLSKVKSILTGRREVKSSPASASSVQKKAKRTLSPEARQRIADAQKKRWAAVRKAAK